MTERSRNEHVAKRLKEARVADGLTQQILADRLGVKTTTISYHESGRRRISIEALARYAEALGRPMDYFLDFG